MADAVTCQIELALALWSRGLSIIPVPRPDGHGHDGKVPTIAWREYQTRRPTEREIHAWFGADPINLAIVTGAVSGVVVVDADAIDALQWATKHLPYTPWQTQTARGFHLSYRHPGVEVRNRARVETGDGRLPIDVRGDGGYVIAPGSVHSSGARYTLAGDWTRTDVPRFWPGWLARPTRAGLPVARGPRPTGEVVERARRYLNAIPAPEIGDGSDTAVLSAACRLVRGFALSEPDAVALLWAWAGGRPGWTPDWIAAKVAHAMRYGSEPIGGLLR